VTLWSRVDGIERSGALDLEIARDPGFGDVVHTQRVRAAQVRDYVVRARVGEGLRPGEQYFYRFATRGVDSPVGRFVTARPRDSREPVRIGFFSCQDYQAGFYTAHAGLAQEPDLDLIVSLGDYIYERTFYEGPDARAATPPAPTATPRCRRCPSTGPSTSSIAATPTCRPCTRPRPSWPSWTTTR